MKEELGINEWLELIKEDKNLNGAYISISQYIYLIEKENQELELELSGYRQAILNNKEMLGLKEKNQELKQKYENAVADYETTMFEKEQLNSLVNSCQEEIRQLKKQLKNYEKLGFKHLQDKNNNLETQQKEFIKWLEDEIKRINPDNLNIGELNLRLDDVKFTQYLIYKEILQKYKEIIGDDQE